MSGLATQIQAAISDEPPLGFTPAEVIAAARRVRRHRRSVYTGAAAGAAAVAAFSTALALPGGMPGHHGQALSLTALAATAAARRAGPTAVPASDARVDGISTAEAIALAEKDTGTTLASVQASVLQPRAELDIAAALAVRGGPYLNIQVTPPHTMSTAMPTCAALSDLASGTGDGYYGPCAIQRLSDGSILIVRSGHTASGGYTMAQATLIRADGAGIFAEDTNQAALTTGQGVIRGRSGGAGKPALPAVIRAEPEISASTLATFVRDLASQALP